MRYIKGYLKLSTFSPGKYKQTKFIQKREDKNRKKRGIRRKVRKNEKENPHKMGKTFV